MKQRTKTALRKATKSPNFSAWPQAGDLPEHDFVLCFPHANCGKAWFGGMTTLRAMADDLEAELYEGLEVAYLKLDHENLELGGFYLTLKEKD